MVSRAVSTDEAGNSYVLVESEDGSTKQVSVTTGFSNSTYIQITGDIQEGDTILIAR